MVKGSGNSAGIVIGRAFVLDGKIAAAPRKEGLDAGTELYRLDEAVEKAKLQLEKLILQAGSGADVKEAGIFETHVELLLDPGYMGKVRENILDTGVSAEWALKEETEKIDSLFKDAGNDMIRERIADVRDVADRVTGLLLGRNSEEERVTGAMPFEVTVVVAKELLPSQVLQLDLEKVKAIAAQEGNTSSHAAILAKARGLAAVMGAEELLAAVSTGDVVILDADTGEIVVNPGEKQLEEYHSRLERQKRLEMLWSDAIGREAAAADGKRIPVEANIAGPGDVLPALAKGADGVGLFRSEFIYMDRNSLPTEEEQFAAYRDAAVHMKGLPLVIRTLDIGGDKPVPYLGLPQENNPFLGFRAIRICLEQRDIFRLQLRAILRASAYGRLSIMFPMISSLEELLQAKTVLEEVKKELDGENMEFDHGISVGVMVETPAAALISDMLAQEADFFSIGTNDLIQYTNAVDRMNGHVAHLYSPYHPAVLRLIRMTAENARKAGIKTAVCGEAAGDTRLIPVLLGLGIDILSVSASLVPQVKWAVGCCSLAEAEKLAIRVVDLPTAGQVKERLEAEYEMQMEKNGCYPGSPPDLK